MSVSSKEIKKKQAYHSMLFGFIIIFFFIMIMIFGAMEITIVSLNPMKVQEVLFNFIMFGAFSFAIIGSSIALLVAFEWFPPEYYNDLQTCPVCGEQELKCIDDCLCYACGATKSDIENNPKSNL